MLKSLNIAKKYNNNLTNTFINRKDIFLIPLLMVKQKDASVKSLLQQKVLYYKKYKTKTIFSNFLLDFVSN